MRTYNSILIEFMHKKDMLVRESTGVRLMSTLDYIEIAETWTEEVCKDVLSRLNTSYDTWICPWCIAFDRDCSICQYAQRHGLCYKHNSTYGAATLGFTKRLCSVPGMRSLVRKTKAAYWLRRIFNG